MEDIAPSISDIQPMLLERAARPFSDPAYVWELKYDGYRMLAEADDGRVLIKSRNGHDATGWFPEVARCLATLPRGRHVLDGEICILDDRGRPDFNRLRARAALKGYKVGADPAVYVVFDLLVERGRSIMKLDLMDRKRRLKRLMAPKPDCVLISGTIEGEQGEALFSEIIALKLEGIVGKRKDAPYEPGIRSSSWIKVKRPGVHDGGWTREPY